MNTRRRLLMVLCVGISASSTLLAQSKKPPVVIGWLHGGSPNTNPHLRAAFRLGMQELGWREGTDYLLEIRYADGNPERMQPLAEELAAKKPALFIASATRTAVIYRTVAPHTPVVQAGGGDLVAFGLAASLARPGGMVTGLTSINLDLNEKRAELLMEIVPRTHRIGLLLDAMPLSLSVTANADSIQRALARYATKPVIVSVRYPNELESAIADLVKNGVQALIVSTSPWLAGQRHNILKLALAHHWPVIGHLPEYAEAGALLSYGPSSEAMHKRAAWYADRILKGAKPGDLPIEQPTTFELVVNLKTAKALGLTVPQTIMVRATRVLQ